MNIYEVVISGATRLGKLKQKAESSSVNEQNAGVHHIFNKYNTFGHIISSSFKIAFN